MNTTNSLEQLLETDSLAITNDADKSVDSSSQPSLHTNTKRQRIWGWAKHLFTLLLGSSAFQLATILFFAISVFQACQQVWYTPVVQAELLTFVGNRPALCVRYPATLKADGNEQRGVISIRLADNISREECISGIISSPAPTATLPLTVTANITITLQPPVQVQATDVLSTALPLINATLPAMVTSFVTPTTPTSSTTAISTAVGITPTQIATNPTTGIQTITTALPLSITLSSSTNLLFVNEKNVSYTPKITLTEGSETSVVVAHALMDSQSTIGTIVIKDADSGLFATPPFNIRLESYGWGLWWRKFLNIFLAPVTGALLAVVAIGLEELRQREREKREESEKREQKERIEKNLHAICEQTVENLSKSQINDVFHMTESWLSRIDEIQIDFVRGPEPQQKVAAVVVKVSEKFAEYAKSCIADFKESNSKHSGLLLRFKQTVGKWNLEQHVPHSFGDFEYTISYFRKPQTLTEYEFIDVQWAGVHANWAWRDSGNQAMIQNELARLKKFDILITGLWISEQVVHNDSLAENTLFRRMRDGYIKEKFSEIFGEEFLHHEELHIAFVQFLQSNGISVYERIKIQREKAEHDELQRRIKKGLPPVRTLWPLAASDNANRPQNDANFDFPLEIEKSDFQGVETLYKTDKGSKQTTNASDICENYLFNDSHHLIIGKHQAGKTWLRIYLEYYLLRIPPEPFIAFCFLPAFLAYRPDTDALAAGIARSVANQLFANLLIRGSLQENELWRAQCADLAQFFQLYNYRSPTEMSILSWPTPARSKLDLDLAYKNSYLRELYSEMKQEVESALIEPTPLDRLTTEQILIDIQRAIKAANYRNVFLLVDNWDDLSHGPRNELLAHLLDPDLLAQLQQRRIHLKIFMPDDVTPEVLQPFQHVCTVRRQAGDKSDRQLDFYLYP